MECCQQPIGTIYTWVMSPDNLFFDLALLSSQGDPTIGLGFVHELLNYSCSQNFEKQTTRQLGFTMICAQCFQWFTHLLDPESLTFSGGTIGERCPD